MKNDQSSVFFKALMTGLFIGIIDTLLCLAFNIGYRSAADYLPSSYINVSSLIFIVNLLLTCIGIVYYLFLRVFRRSDALFFTFMALLTAFLLWRIAGIHRFADTKENNGFKGLLDGILLIVGISSACLPFFYRSRKFVEAVI